MVTHRSTYQERDAGLAQFKDLFIGLVSIPQSHFDARETKDKVYRCKGTEVLVPWVLKDI
jgi:hypothetical protein